MTRRIHRQIYGILIVALLFSNIVMVHAVLPMVRAVRLPSEAPAVAVVAERIQTRPDVQPDPYDALWAAVCEVESSGDAGAVGDGGDSVGIAQISTICVKDCNRIVGHQRWALADRLDPIKSRAMFDCYTNHYEPDGSAEAICRLWNSGPGWASKKHLTERYWQKVRKILSQNR